MTDRRQRVVTTKYCKRGSGCRTCRDRRVKCDGARPSCRKCSSFGRVCGGYTSQKQDTVEHSRSIAPALCYSIAAAVAATALESHALNYFLKTDLPSLALVFPTEWIQLTMSLVSRDPAVFGACIAVGRVSLLQTRITHHSLEHETSFAQDCETIQLHGKAIQALQKTVAFSGQEQASEAALVCCTLFSFLEIMQDNTCQALAHLRSGLQVGKIYLQISPSKSARALVNTLLQFQGDTVVSARPMALERATLNFTLPHRFESTGHAKWALDELTASRKRLHETLLSDARDAVDSLSETLEAHVRFAVTQSMARLPPLSDCEHQLLCDFARWKVELDRLEEDSHHCPHEFALLCIQYFTSFHQLRTRSHTSQPSHNGYESEFVSILDLINKVLEKHLPAPHPEPKPPAPMDPIRSFSIDNTILAPSQLIALKSSRKATRERAIDILRNARRFEGVHWSYWLAAHAKYALKLEEERAPKFHSLQRQHGELPESLRFLDLVVAVGPVPNESVTKMVGTRFRTESDGHLEVVEYHGKTREVLQLEFVRSRVLPSVVLPFSTDGQTSKEVFSTGGQVRLP